MADLLDAAVYGLRERAKEPVAVQMIRGGRLVEVERLWACAAGALGIGAGDVAAGRLRQATARRGIVLENSAVLAAIVEVVETEQAKAEGQLSDAGERPAWIGTITALLGAVNSVAPTGRFEKDWPRTPGDLARHLATLRRVLHALGWQ